MDVDVESVSLDEAFESLAPRYQSGGGGYFGQDFGKEDCENCCDRGREEDVQSRKMKASDNALQFSITFCRKPLCEAFGCVSDPCEGRGKSN